MNGTSSRDVPRRVYKTAPRGVLPCGAVRFCYEKG